MIVPTVMLHAGMHGFPSLSPIESKVEVGIQREEATAGRFSGPPMTIAGRQKPTRTLNWTARGWPSPPVNWFRVRKSVSRWSAYQMPPVPAPGGS